MLAMNMFGSPNAPSQVIPVHQLIQPQQLQQFQQQHLIQITQQQPPPPQIQQQQPKKAKSGGKSKSSKGAQQRHQHPSITNNLGQLQAQHFAVSTAGILASPPGKRVIAKKKSTFYNRGEGTKKRLAAAQHQSSSTTHGGGSGLLNLESLGAYLHQRFASNFSPVSSEALRVAAREYIGDVQNTDLASIFYMTAPNVAAGVPMGAISPNAFLGLTAAMEVKFGQGDLREHQMSRRIASALANHTAISAAVGVNQIPGGAAPVPAGTGRSPHHHAGADSLHQAQILVFSPRLLANMPPRVVSIFGAEPPQQVDLVAEARGAKIVAGTPDQCTNQLAVLLLKRCVAEDKLRIVSAAESKHYITLPETLRNAIFDVLACVCAVESEENFYEPTQIREAALRNEALSDFIQRKIQSFLHEHRRTYNHGRQKFIIDGKEVVASMYEAHQFRAQQQTAAGAQGGHSAEHGGYFVEANPVEASINDGGGKAGGVVTLITKLPNVDSA